MAVRVKTDQFCGLATNAIWQAWLYHYSEPMFQELATHLRTSSGCGANREKMVKLLERILADPGGRSQFNAFLNSEFPYMLEDDSVPAKPPGPHPAYPQQQEPLLDPSNVPFHDNAVGMFSYPRRVILRDPGSMNQQINKLLSDSPEYETQNVAGVVFVEYLPPEAIEYKGRVPAQNWLIRVWREGYRANR